MRFLSLTVATLCAALIVSPVLAKDKHHEKPMDEKAMMELWQQPGTPGDPHKQLESLAGSWTTETKHWMQPGKPPMESTGTVEMKPVLGERFLQQEYTGQMMGQPYSGIGTTGYDNLRKKYVSTWIDSMGTGIFVMEGTATADGTIITLKGGHDEPGGGHMTHRAVWRLIDHNSQIFEMYGAHKGEKESKHMEIVYTRKP